MGHKHIYSKKDQFNRKRHLLGFLIMIAALIDIAEKRPEEIAYTLTSIYLPVLTYETEYGSEMKEYVASYDVPEWFYEDEDYASVNNDLASTEIGAGDINDVVNDDNNKDSVENADNINGGDNRGQEESKPVIKNMSAGTTYTREQLSKPDFLTSKIFTVDNNTSMSSDELNIANLLDMDMSIESLRESNSAYAVQMNNSEEGVLAEAAQMEGPEEEACAGTVSENAPYKVLIYHTHTSESFIDSRKGVAEDTIAGVGAYLTRLLNEQYNIPTYHDETVYDVIDGKLDRSKAYENSFNGISKILADNPSIEVVIDLHRDGVDEETHLVTEVNGKPTAKIMFLNGVSRSNLNGEIGYLENPNKISNLAFSFQLYLAGKEDYGDYVRKIYVRSLRYNLHVMPRATLIEAGAQNNTIEEEMNAMEPLAAMLNKVLRGK